jgi:sugar (pentulose or hexulose) kinase
VEAGSASLEEAWRQAREDVARVEARCEKERESAATAAALVLESTKEKAAFEVQTARDGSAAGAYTRSLQSSTLGPSITHRSR